MLVELELVETPKMIRIILTTTMATTMMMILMKII
jgi:hypothetical protein